jgi:hypothetical protein
MPVIEGGGLGDPLSNAGAPVSGTDEVQTLTIGGAPTAGAGSGFTLAYMGFTTALILWSATNNTLRDNIDAALEALPVIGTGNVTTAVGTATAGVGTFTITFAGGLAKHAVATITVGVNSMTGAAPTVAVAETTPGVDATALGAAKGGLLIDITNAILYINTGTPAAPTWTKVGTQT